MKIRTGFISNSSSSSFVCDVCGSIESGMDASLSNFDMSSCVNGHSFHNNCAEMGKVKIDMKQSCIDYINNRDKKYYTIEENLEELKQLETIDKDDLEDYWRELVCEDGLPAELCPICTMKHLDNSDMTEYLLKKVGMTKKDIFVEVKEKFNSYDDFTKFLRSKT